VKICRSKTERLKTLTIDNTGKIDQRLIKFIKRNAVLIEGIRRLYLIPFKQIQRVILWRKNRLTYLISSFKNGLRIRVLL
jgi:hypothetical protein